MASATASGDPYAGAMTGRGSPRSASPREAEQFSCRCAEIEAGLQARLGVCVIDTQTDIALGYRADERFPMCSTVKTLACGALLQRVDQGGENLDRVVRFGQDTVVDHSPITGPKAGGPGMRLAEICEATITVSDNTALNLILEMLGGPEGLTRFVRTLGDDVTRVDRWELELSEAQDGDPRDTTSPRAMASDMRLLLLGDVLSPGSRERLASWLASCSTGVLKLRAGFPSAWRVGDKTGSGGFGTSNDVAVVWPPHRAPVVLAMYVTQTVAPAPACNAAFVDIARLVASLLEP